MAVPLLRRTALPAAVLLAGLVLPPAEAGAQVANTEGFCIVGRPRPSCAAFLVLQVDEFGWAGGTRVEPGSRETLYEHEIETHFDWEVGAMLNRRGGTAVGAAVLVGSDGRLALKGRYRRWLSRHVALDAGLGPFRVEAPGEAESEPYVGLTGDVSLGLTDWAMAGARFEVGWKEPGDRPARAAYVGVRLGTFPGVFWTLIRSTVLDGTWLPTAD